MAQRQGAQSPQFVKYTDFKYVVDERGPGGTRTESLRLIRARRSARTAFAGSPLFVAFREFTPPAEEQDCDSVHRRAASWLC